MNVTFQRQSGDPSLGIIFFWRMMIDTERPQCITDLFIPELFYDFFFIKTGDIQCSDGPTTFALPQQSLKTIFTRPLRFHFQTPLDLFGARLSLNFGEFFWEQELTKNRFLTQTWLLDEPASVSDFKTRVMEIVGGRKKPKNPYPMLTPTYVESGWLAAYSPRHKRRLYKATFGLSRKELDSVRSVQSFLEQTCDFAAEYPRIIEHINPEVFYDQPHLNHTFKKVTGLSPLAYFEANSILQDNLMAASYNVNTAG